MNQAEFTRRYGLISERLRNVAKEEKAGGKMDTPEIWARKRDLVDQLEQLLDEYERA